MKFLPELGIKGNIERIFTEMKNQKNKSILTDSNVDREVSRGNDLEDAILELADIVGGLTDG